MADKKFYCYCENGCKYETMSKEQILAAITQAVESGTIGNCDTGFIQTIKTINGLSLRFFVGAQYEYDALSDEEKKNLYAIITNDATQAGILEAIETLEENYEKLVEGLSSGTFIIPSEQRLYNCAFDDETISRGTLLEIGKLPSGKTVDDIVGVGLEVGLTTETYDNALRFSAGKTRQSVFNPMNGMQEIPFNLTNSLISSATHFGITNMDVAICSKDGKLYIYFENGSYSWFNITDGSCNNENLNSGKFILFNVCYWFA